MLFVLLALTAIISRPYIAHINLGPLPATLHPELYHLTFLKKGSGTITCVDTELFGDGTKFQTEFQVGDSVYIKGHEPNLVLKILSDTKLIVKTAYDKPIEVSTRYKV